jgi:hypothetical protein
MHTSWHIIIHCHLFKALLLVTTVKAGRFVEEKPVLLVTNSLAYSVYNTTHSTHPKG